MDELLLQKYLQNKVSESELIEVLDWLDADTKNQKQLDELDFVLNVDTLIRPSKTLGNKRSIPLWKSALRWSVRVAAVMFISVGLGYWFANEMVNNNSRNMTTIAAPNGQRVSVTLGDGTQVWLNSGAKLEYPSVFSKKERRVKVSGEAMFDVEHDAKHPFVVETFACETEVLGTKFNIHADAEATRFSVALLEGRLKVSNRNKGEESFLLSPDEMVELVDGHLRHNKISSHDEYLWVDGLVSLNNLGFEELMRKFERVYGVNIVVETPDVPQTQYKGKLRVSSGIDYALGVLQLTSDFSYVKNDDVNTIYIK